MKAEASFIVNQKEIDLAHLTGIDPPSREYEYKNFYFSREYVANFYKSAAGHIVVSMHGEKWFLKYNNELWAILKAYLNSK